MKFSAHSTLRKFIVIKTYKIMRIREIKEFIILKIDVIRNYERNPLYRKTL